MDIKTKLLFFDVDGTLIDDESKDIPYSVFDAIRETRSRGNLVFINTGRVLRLTKKLAQLLHVDGAVCGCGTHIIIGDETIYKYELSLKRCNELKELFKKYKLDVVIESQKGLYFAAAPFRYTTSFDVSKWDIPEENLFFNSLDNTDFTFDKFSAEEPPQDKEGYREFLEQLTDFNCIKREKNFHECVPKGCSKGTGVNYLMDYYGIAPEDTYIFGDSNNDLEMFKSRAGNRIVMRDFAPELAPYATYITDSPKNDGIAKAMRHFKLV